MDESWHANFHALPVMFGCLDVWMFGMEPLIAASIGFAFQKLKLGGASIAMPPLGWPPVQKRGCFFNPSNAFQCLPADS